MIFTSLLVVLMMTRVSKLTSTCMRLRNLKPNTQDSKLVHLPHVFPNSANVTNVLPRVQVGNLGAILDFSLCFTSHIQPNTSLSNMAHVQPSPRPCTASASARLLHLTPGRCGRLLSGLPAFVLPLSNTLLILTHDLYTHTHTLQHLKSSRGFPLPFR